MPSEWARLIATYRVHSLQHSIAIDVHIHRPPTLNTPIHHPIPHIRKPQILFLERHHRVSDRKFDLRKVIRCSGSGEDVALVALVVFGAWDGFVDGVDEVVGDEAESGAGVHNRGVARSIDSLAVDGGGCGFDLPETLAVIDIGIVGLGRAGSGHDVLVDETEGVETLEVGQKDVRVNGTRHLLLPCRPRSCRASYRGTR